MQFCIQFFVLLILAVALCSGGGCVGKESSESTNKTKGGDGKNEKPPGEPIQKKQRPQHQIAVSKPEIIPLIVKIVGTRRPEG
uniref:Secreted protein n=1 Tax=Globodera pallida TaxID=36090 RepID=A0A183BRL6_GLOPA